MKAKLLYQNKYIFEDFITELVIWQLPNQTPDRPHGLKYRLYHGKKNGACIVRYDNETGKGDHKHIGNLEVPYCFTSIENLVKDFINDINYLTKEMEKDE